MRNFLSILCLIQVYDLINLLNSEEEGACCRGKGEGRCSFDEILSLFFFAKQQTDNKTVTNTGIR
jgi:hypothetical protein